MDSSHNVPRPAGLSEVSLVKSVIVTRGRTGSTAITQELGNVPDCWSLQEIFSVGNYAGSEFPYFVAWREQSSITDPREAASVYLRAVHQAAQERGAKALFWKALNRHFLDVPSLGELLASERYQAIYLKRCPVRQTLSGLVARQRGRYNTMDTDYRDTDRYTIDLREFHSHVNSVAHSEERDRRLLNSAGIPFFEITYEDYQDRRRDFFANIYGRLGLPLAEPEASTWQIMIPDLRQTITNYEDVAMVAAELGHPL